MLHFCGLGAFVVLLVVILSESRHAEREAEAEYEVVIFFIFEISYGNALFLN